MLGTEGLRSRFEPAGAGFRVYRYAPDNDLRQRETDLLKEWEARTPLGAFARVRDKVIFGPARLFCRDITEELGAFPEAFLAGLDGVGADGLLEREHQPGPDGLDDGRGAAFFPRDRVVEVAVADRVDEGDGPAAGRGGHLVAHQVTVHDQDAGGLRAADELVRRQEDGVLVVAGARR